MSAFTTVTSFNDARASPWAGVHGSRIAVDELLGSIILPACPLLVTIRQLAQERRCARLVRDAVGPLTKLGSDGAVAGATLRAF